jgi:hypothetical protein
MEVQDIIAELKNETKRLNEAIATLERLGSTQSATKNHTSVAAANDATMRQSSMGKQTRGRLTAEGRKRLSEAMKKALGSETKISLVELLPGQYRIALAARLVASCR